MKFTICGSAKFEAEFHEWNKKLGLMGHVSYSLMTFPSIEGAKTWYTPEQKELLDLAHLAKIEESDAILVLNKDGYIGESTKREIKWAKLRNKTIYYLEPVGVADEKNLMQIKELGLSTRHIPDLMAWPF